MNVKIKLFLFINLSFFMIISSGYSFGFSACSVNFNQPWLDVKDKVSNDDVLIIDNNGNSFFRGVNHNLNNINTQNSFKIGTAHFNKVTSKFTSFNPNQINLPNTQSLVIKNNLGVGVAKIDKLGNIFTKGKGVFQGSQAGCAPDGLYCNGPLLENRNNYCNINANKAGTCTYNILSSENCLTKLSTDTDSGINYNQKGTVTDYTGCNSAACTSITKTDFCSGNILTEFANSGASVSTNTKNCAIDNQQYCTNGQVWTTTNTCGVGKCSVGTDQFLQNCAVTPTQYSTWTCQNINTKIRTITTFSPICAGPATCSQTSSNSNQAVSCGAGNYCSGGNCNALSYSWKTSGFGACSATCGGGTKSRSVWCEDNLGNTVANSFCGGGKPTVSQSCNTQSCNVFSWSVGNYGSCSLTCGGGTQTRSVVCKNQFGTTFADANCGGGKPTVSQSCNTQSCNVCVDSTWTPLVSNVALGKNYVQTSNCGTVRNAIGTKNYYSGTGCGTCPEGFLDIGGGTLDCIVPIGSSGLYGTHIAPNNPSYGYVTEGVIPLMQASCYIVNFGASTWRISTTQSSTFLTCPSLYLDKQNGTKIYQNNILKGNIFPQLQSTIYDRIRNPLEKGDKLSIRETNFYDVTYLDKFELIGLNSLKNKDYIFFDQDNNPLGFNEKDLNFINSKKQIKNFKEINLIENISINKQNYLYLNGGITDNIILKLRNTLKNKFSNNKLYLKSKEFNKKILKNLLIYVNIEIEFKINKSWEKLNLSNNLILENNESKIIKLPLGVSDVKIKTLNGSYIFNEFGIINEDMDTNISINVFSLINLNNLKTKDGLYFEISNNKSLKISLSQFNESENKILNNSQFYIKSNGYYLYNKNYVRNLNSSFFNDLNFYSNLYLIKTIFENPGNNLEEVVNFIN